MFLFFRCKRLTINPTSYIFNSPSEEKEKLIEHTSYIWRRKKYFPIMYIFQKNQSHIISFQFTLQGWKTHQADIIYFRKIYFQNVILSKQSSITRHIFSIPPLRKKTSHKCSLEHQVMAATNCWTSSLNVKLTENFDVGPKSTYFV